MPDTRFFKAPEPIELGRLLSGLDVDIDGSQEHVITDVAALDKAGASDISFLDNAKYKDDFRQTKAGACVIHPDNDGDAPDDVILIKSPSPYKTYALIAQRLYPDELPKAHVASSAVINKGVKIGDGCVIEDNVSIKSGVKIGKGCWIGAGVVIDENVEIGDNSRIGANAVISHALIGNNVRIYRGVCVGQDGFGFAIDPTGFVKVPQLGRVVIEDSVEIGANTTIDRGAGPDTIIGTGTWIDNLVQIGHNVKIGKYCVIVSQVGISGSTILEDFVVLAGQVGVAGHIKIGAGTRVAAKSGIMRDIEPGQEYMGYPAVPIKNFMKQVALLKKIVKNKGMTKG